MALTDIIFPQTTKTMLNYINMIKLFVSKNNTMKLKIEIIELMEYITLKLVD